MDLVEIYSASLGAVCILLIGWNLAAATVALQHKLRSEFHAQLMQNVLKRRRGSGDYTISVLLQIVIVVAANAVSSALSVDNLDQLGVRLGTLALVNAMPLFLGGRTSFIAERILGVSLPWYGIMHNWIGRILIIESVAHGFILLSKKSGSARYDQIVLLTLLCTMALTSVVAIRRRFYEIFLKLHHLLSLAIIALLWLHINIGQNFPTICLGVSSGLWIMQLATWTFQYWLRNYRQAGRSRLCRVICCNNGESNLTVAIVDIPLLEPWHITDGQYIYITIPLTKGLRYRFQAHPYLVAWASEDFNHNFECEEPTDIEVERRRASSSKIQVLIGCREGFSWAIHHEGKRHENWVEYETPFLIDGFYGHGPSLESYDKVFFIAGGIGVAAHLLAIRHLLISHENQTARVRRLSLLWHVHSQDSMEWAMSIFRQLMQLDKSRQIFNIYVYCDEGTDFMRVWNERNTESYRLEASATSPDIRKVMTAEANLDAGNMAVSVCGGPALEDEVRKAVRTCKPKVHVDIRLFVSAFRPEEETPSHARRGV